MNLAVFLSPGDSLANQAKTGQDERFINYYLKKYSKNFNKIFIFSYGDKEYKKKLPNNVLLLSNKHKISYPIYQFLLPFLYLNKLKNCQVMRVMQAAGAIPAIIAKLLFGKKIVLTYGYDYFFFAKIEKKYLTAFILELLIPIALRFADKIIVTSKINEKKLNKKYPGKVAYIPNGVDVSKFKAPAILIRQLAEKDPLSCPRHPEEPACRQAGLRSKDLLQRKGTINILSIGRLVRQKNFRLLIDATGLLKDKKNINLTIIGKGLEKNNLINQARQTNVNLKIIEPTPYDKLISYYQKADIFCLPSLAEGQSKVLLEALACGLPVLASDTPANKEIAKDKATGILFDFDKNDLASKITQLINNPRQAQKIRLQGRKYVEQNHNLTKLIEKEISLLKFCVFTSS